MLKPVSGSHSISRVIANIFLPQNLVKPDYLFKKIVDSEQLIKYQKRGLSTTKTINLNKNNLNISNEEVHGFIFEEFNAGKSVSILKTENVQNKAQISFENREYKRWDKYKNRFYSDLEVLAGIFEIYLEAISLTYVDEFIWISEEKIDVNQIFDTDSELLNSSFINSYNGSMILISQSEKKENIQFEEEKTEVLFNNDVKRIIVNHTFAIKLDEIKIYNSDKELVKKCFEIAHKANKDLLGKIFVEGIQYKIGLKTE